MKRTFLYFSAFFLMAGSISCKKSLSDLYQNPDAFTSTSIEYLFPQGIQSSAPVTYGDGVNRILGQMAPMMQTLGSTNANPANLYKFIQASSASSAGAIDFGRWQYYYNTSMIQFKLIDAMYYWQLTPDQQAGYKVYYEMTKVMEAYNTAQTSDLFGDIPYSQAFTRSNSKFNQPVYLHPEWDAQQSIYDSVLTNLKEAGAYFDTAQLQTSVYNAQALLATQDILYKGVLSSWSAFANSLRLRYAMRLSAADPSRAQAEITDIVNNKKPLILTNATNALLYNNAQSGGYFAQAAAENNATETYLSQYTDSVMHASVDPRLQMLYYTDASNAGVYKGLPVSQQDRTTNTGVKGMYAYLNPLVWGYNYAAPIGIMIDASEVNFYLAEAAQKGIIPGGDATAQTYYNNGVIQSVLMYYSIYQTAPSSKTIGTGASQYTYTKATIAQPTVPALTAWLNSSAYAYNSGKAMEQIALQKWLHSGFFQIDETYAEFRRLKQPVLLPDMLNGVQMNTTYPVRVPYPTGTSEANNNAENFAAAVAATNNNSYAFPVWWNK